MTNSFIGAIGHGTVSGMGYYNPPSNTMDTLTVNGTMHINGINLEDFMKSVSERLLILTPDPEKLEKYEALKIAYSNYKLLESLLAVD